MTLDIWQQLLFEKHHPTPTQSWWQAFAATSRSPKPRAWVARHLKADNSHPSAWYALAHFVPMMIAGRWHIATPQESPDFGNRDAEYVERLILAVDPETDTAHVINYDRPAIVGPVEGDVVTVRSSPLQWLRDWADARAIWLARFQDARAMAHVTVPHCDEPPTTLVIGDPSKAAWGCVSARKVVAPADIQPIIKKQIFKAAALPFVEAA